MKSESLSEESIVAMEIQAKDIYSEGGSLFFVADSLSDAFVPPDVMSKYAWTGSGKEIRWRHQKPEDNVDALIGHVHKAWFENGKIKTLNEVWGYREDLKKIQEQIKNNELSISLGYKKSKDSSGNIVGIYIREQSITPIPKCTSDLGCGIESIIETNEESKMSTKLDERLEKLEKSVIAQSEERKERIVELEATVNAMEQRIQSSNEIIAEYQEKLEKLEKENIDLKQKTVASSTESLRNEIVTLERITDEEARKQELKELLQYNESDLVKMRDRIKRAMKISDKISGNKQKPVLGEAQQSNEEQTELDSLSPEQLAAKLNPELGKYIRDNNGSYKTQAPTGYGAGNKDDIPIINDDQ